MVKTGWRSIAKEVWTAGNLGSEYAIANHPITWLKNAKSKSHPCIGHDGWKSIGSTYKDCNGNKPRINRPNAQPAVESNCKFAAGARSLFANL